jgi:uncharacterized protein (DUF2147 family)
VSIWKQPNHHKEKSRKRSKNGSNQNVVRKCRETKPLTWHGTTINLKEDKSFRKQTTSHTWHSAVTKEIQERVKQR